MIRGTFQNRTHWADHRINLDGGGSISLVYDPGLEAFKPGDRVKLVTIRRKNGEAQGYDMQPLKSTEEVPLYKNTGSHTRTHQ